MQKMIVDECMSPRVVPALCEMGYDAIHVRDRGMLQAEDYQVWRFALEEDRFVCTINAGHFKKLASLSEIHPGVVIFPNGHNPPSQLNLIMSALAWVTTTNAATGFINRYVEIGDSGEIILSEIVYYEET
jgi:predicted nuclease of predicted toxin-antitoxin system